MTTNTVVEKMVQAAIDGGWRKDVDMAFYLEHWPEKIDIHKALLDPTFWLCAGKSLEWFQIIDDKETKYYEWKDKQVYFVQCLQDGHDIDSALEKIV